MQPIDRKSWKFKLLMFVAMRVVKVPLFIDFTRPDESTTSGIGFAWTPEMADRMVAKHQTLPPKATRSVRRAINRAAKDNARGL